jgi:outer membrane protein assembly factor BamB
VIPKVKTADGSLHTVLFVPFNGALTALDATSGKELWSYDDAGPFASPAGYGAGAAARVAFGDGNKLVELNAGTGTVAWSHLTTGLVSTPVALDEKEALIRGVYRFTVIGIVYGEDSDGDGFSSIQEAAPGAGTTMWRTVVGGAVNETGPTIAGPAIANGVLYAGVGPCKTCTEGALEVFNVSTGAGLASVDIGPASPAPPNSPSPSVADGRVYIGAFGGGLRVLALPPAGH